MTTPHDLTERELKRCPDCAEAVLAEARKCRYCGYRFDGGRFGQTSLLASLLNSKQPADHLTPTELVADLGVALAPGEDVKVLAFCHVQSRHGYLVLTDRRLVFLEHVAARNYRQLFERPLPSVIDAELSGGIRRCLTVHGTGYDFVARGLRRGVPELLLKHLPAAPPA
jgi:hypothetical protein